MLRVKDIILVHLAKNRLVLFQKPSPVSHPPFFLILKKKLPYCPELVGPYTHPLVGPYNHHSGMKNSSWRNPFTNFLKHSINNNLAYAIIHRFCAVNTLPIPALSISPRTVSSRVLSTGVTIFALFCIQQCVRMPLI